MPFSLGPILKNWIIITIILIVLGIVLYMGMLSLGQAVAVVLVLFGINKICLAAK